MAGLPWFKLASDFPSHPKTQRLALKLRDPNAGMYVVRLWAFCAQHAGDGRLDGESVESIIELACEWKGARRGGALVEALVACGFLELQPGGVYVVHGWEERNGAHARKAERDARKPRGNKARPAPVPRGTDEGQGREDGGSRGGEGEGEKEETPPLARERAGDEGDGDAPQQREAAPPAGAASGAGGEEQGPASPPAVEAPRPRPPQLAERFPALYALVGALEAAGFQAEPPKDDRTKGLVDAIAKRDTVAVCAERLLAVVRADRAAGVEPRPWLGWHLDTLEGKPKGSHVKRAARAGAEEAAAAAARREAAIAREADACEESARTLRRLFEMVRPDFFDTWATGLRGELDGQTLRFRHPEPGKALFWADQHHALLLRAAREANGAPLHVEITGPGAAEGRA